MKPKRAFLGAIVALLVAVPSAWATERDLLVEEVRGLRRDLHAVAVVAQRIQLLVYRVHVQAEVTRRAKAGYDTMTQSLRYIEFEATHTTEMVTQLESKIRSESDRAKKSDLESTLESAKARSTQVAETLAKQRAAAEETQREWEREQARLDELTSRLDQMERQLEGLSASLIR